MKTTKRIDTFHAEQLVAWFAHHMTMEQRHKLMREMPAAYNGMCGYEVVAVVLVAETKAV
jgi:hypothetical protein